MPKLIDASWTAAETIPALPADEVHVWKVQLDLLTGEESEVTPFTADVNHARATARDDVELRRRATARRILKTILAGYLNLSPAEVQICNNSFGKPALDSRHHRESIEFNVSHSRNVALIAVAANSHLGIDIECVDRNFPIRNVMRHFSASGLFAVGDPASATDANSFFELWTRNEAYAKATGLGFSGLLARRSETCSTSELDSNNFSITSFRAGGEFMGAIATSAGAASIRFFNYSRSPLRRT
jgi:4'-phosphopantetheinyl transferase